MTGTGVIPGGCEMRLARTARAAAAVACVGALVAASCGQSNDDPAMQAAESTAASTATAAPVPDTEAPPTAFVDVVVVTMTTDAVLPGQTVLAAGDRIVAIGPVGEIDVPDDAIVIEGRGAYLMPGLADMHVHLDAVWPVPMLDLFLAKGVTTVRNLNARDPTVLAWRDEVEDRTRRGPTIFTAGPTIFEDAEDLDAVVAAQLDQGYDLVKLYSYLSAEGFAEAMSAVRDHGGYAVGHVPFAVGLEGVIAAGMDEIAHIEELTFELIDFDRSADLGIGEWLPYVFERAEAELQSPGANEVLGTRIAAVVDALRGTDVPVATTVFLSDLIVQKLLRPEEFLARPELGYMPPAYLAEFAAGAEKHQVQFADHEDISVVRYAAIVLLLQALHEADVPLLLGTDAGTGHMGLVPGFTIHDELAVLTANGFTPFEAIETGTVNASAAIEAMTGSNDFGTIEIGKRADLVLVGANPLEDVSHIEVSLQGVMAAGIWYPQAELDEMIAHQS